MRWYYAVDSQKRGPVTKGEVEQLFQNGTITSSTLVWNDLTGWVSYGQMKTGAAKGRFHPQCGASSSAAQAACAECGRAFPVQEMVRYGQRTVCAACKPAFFQKVKEGASIPGAMVYAGFWTRFGAKFIDWIILYVVNMAVTFAAGSSMTPNMQAGQNPAAVAGPMLALFALQMAIQATYSTFFVGKFRATPGKMALGILIVSPDGGQVSYARALGRHFAEFLSSIILLIGYLMAAFDEEKRALHDRICSTRVVTKQK